MYFACHNVLIEDRSGLQTVSLVLFYCEATVLLVNRMRLGITNWVVLYLFSLRYVHDFSFQMWTQTKEHFSFCVSPSQMS